MATVTRNMIIWGDSAYGGKYQILDHAEATRRTHAECMIQPPKHPAQDLDSEILRCMPDVHGDDRDIGDAKEGEWCRRLDNDSRDVPVHRRALLIRESLTRPSPSES